MNLSRSIRMRWWVLAIAMCCAPFALAQSVDRLTVEREADRQLRSDDAAAMKQFAPLIGKVRGAIRDVLEIRKACLPWATLAREPADAASYFDLGFDEQIGARMGGLSAPAIGKLVAMAARERGLGYSVVGTCERDASQPADAAPSVIALVLEAPGQPARKLSFPFQRSETGQVVYLQAQARIVPTAPVVFTSARP